MWDARKARERHRLSGHTGWVRRCAISPDCTFIVTASFDRRLRVWDAQTGATRRVLVGHTDGVTDCVVSPDSSFIVSASLDETVRIWDAQTGELRRTLAAQWGDERGGWIVQRTARGHLAGVYACAMSPDGSRIASASSDQTVKLWDTRTGEELHTLSGHTSMVVGCAFSPDGALLASAGADGALRLWECHSGQERLMLTGHSGAVSACAFDPQGRWLVSVASDRLLKFWDVATGQELDTYSGHTDIINGCAVAPDGSYVVSVGLDGAMKLWESPRTHATATPTEQHSAWVNGCAVSRTGHMAASASSDATIRLWDTRSGAGGRVLSGHTGSVRGCVFGPFERQLVSASADKSVKDLGCEHRSHHRHAHRSHGLGQSMQRESERPPRVVGSQRPDASLVGHSHLVAAAAHRRSRRFGQRMRLRTERALLRVRVLRHDAQDLDRRAEPRMHGNRCRSTING